jgi:hypothetical protein
MTMMCVQCYLDGRRVPVGLRVDKNPPFAFMVYDGKSLCVDHLPEPVGGREPLMAVPDQLPAMAVVRDPVQTDNRFVVEEGTTPKKAPTKRAPRKRTKS